MAAKPAFSTVDCHRYGKLASCPSFSVGPRNWLLPLSGTQSRGLTSAPSRCSGLVLVVVTSNHAERLVFRQPNDSKQYALQGNWHLAAQHERSSLDSASSKPVSTICSFNVNERLDAS